jgi:hypothetical protein
MAHEQWDFFSKVGRAYKTLNSFFKANLKYEIIFLSKYIIIFRLILKFILK